MPHPQCHTQCHTLGCRLTDKRCLFPWSTVPHPQCHTQCHTGVQADTEMLVPLVHCATPPECHTHVTHTLPEVQARCRGACDCSFLWSTALSVSPGCPPSSPHPSLSSSSRFTDSTSPLCTARHRERGSWKLRGEGRRERGENGGRRRRNYARVIGKKIMILYMVVGDCKTTQHLKKRD